MIETIESIPRYGPVHVWPAQPLAAFVLEVSRLSARDGSVVVCCRKDWVLDFGFYTTLPLVLRPS